MKSHIPRRWLRNSWGAVLLMACVIAAPRAQDGVPSPATTPAEGRERLEDLTFASDPASLARSAIGNLPGSSAVGVWRAGETSYAGYRDGALLSAQQVAGDNGELFEIGSITKIFTGLLLAHAVDRGDLSLDDTLGKLLDGKASLQSSTVSMVTLRQLITHTSCLPRLPADFRGGLDSALSYRTYSRERMWKSLADMASTRAPPCESVYSNFGVAIVGELLSERYGMSWDALVAERITEPLGMADTVRVLGAKRSRLAPAHRRTDSIAPWEMDAFRGAGSLHSTPADLLKFGRALLAGRAGPLGAPAERLLTPLAWFDGEIGYAIFIRGPEGHRTYLHTGLTGGYASELVLAADTKEVVVLLTSNSEAPVFRVGNILLSARYPVTPGNRSIESARLAEYAGVYQVDPTRKLTYTAQDGVLYYHYIGGRFAAMSPAAPDAFTIGTSATHQFERVDGKTVAVTASGKGADFHAVRTGDSPPTKAVLPESDIKGLLGTYRGRLLTFDVRSEGGQLMVRVDKQLPYPVFLVGDRPDHFAYDIVKAELQFERYPNGEARSIELFQNGRTQEARRID